MPISCLSRLIWNTSKRLSDWIFFSYFAWKIYCEYFFSVWVFFFFFSTNIKGPDLLTEIALLHPICIGLQYFNSQVPTQWNVRWGRLSSNFTQNKPTDLTGCWQGLEVVLPPLNSDTSISEVYFGCCGYFWTGCAHLQLHWSETFQKQAKVNKKALVRLTDGASNCVFLFDSQNGSEWKTVLNWSLWSLACPCAGRALCITWVLAVNPSRTLLQWGDGGAGGVSAAHLAVPLNSELLGFAFINCCNSDGAYSWPMWLWVTGLHLWISCAGFTHPEEQEQRLTSSLKADKSSCEQICTHTCLPLGKGNS